MHIQKVGPESLYTSVHSWGSSPRPAPICKYSGVHEGVHSSLPFMSQRRCKCRGRQGKAIWRVQWDKLWVCFSFLSCLEAPPDTELPFTALHSCLAPHAIRNSPTMLVQDTKPAICKTILSDACLNGCVIMNVQMLAVRPHLDWCHVSVRSFHLAWLTLSCISYTYTSIWLLRQKGFDSTLNGTLWHFLVLYAQKSVVYTAHDNICSAA